MFPAMPVSVYPLPEATHEQVRSGSVLPADRPTSCPLFPRQTQLPSNAFCTLLPLGAHGGELVSDSEILGARPTHGVVP